jgi:hypothetical protein
MRFDRSFSQFNLSDFSYFVFSSIAMLSTPCCTTSS